MKWKLRYNALCVMHWLSLYVSMYLWFWHLICACACMRICVCVCVCNVKCIQRAKWCLLLSFKCHLTHIRISFFWRMLINIYTQCSYLMLIKHSITLYCVFCRINQFTIKQKETKRVKKQIVFNILFNFWLQLFRAYMYF